MKTKRTPKAAAPAVTPVPPVNPVPPPAPPPELDLEPWKVVTTQSKPKEIMGRLVIIITARLQYRGQTLASLQGVGAQAVLQTMANQRNATRRVPVTHKKAYADLGEASRSATAADERNLNNIIQPFEG